MNTRARLRIVLGVLGAALAVTLAFACGSDDEVGAPCDGATCDGGTGDENNTPADGASASFDVSARDGATDAIDGSDAAETGPKCSGDAGALDLTFGNGGLLVPPITGAGGAALTYQPDGKLLVGGQHIDAFAVLRFSANGTVDGTFGTGGMATATVGAARGIVRALAIQPDGKIVAVGQGTTADDDIAVARFLQDGTLDASFGAGGVVIQDLGGTDDSASSLTIQPDGSILVSGTKAPKNTGNYDFVLLRYTPTGTIDTAYGSGGKVSVDVRNSSDQLGALVRLPSGKVIVGGYSSGPSPALRYDPSLVRLDTNGTVDPTFGTAGKVVTDFGPIYPRVVNAIALDPAGMVLLGGGVGLANQDFSIYRFSASGLLDTTLGDAGVLQTDFGGREAISGIGAASDGRIFAAGSTDGQSGRRVFILASYLANGTLDPSFGLGGKSVTDFGDPTSVSLPGIFVSKCTVTLAASVTTVVGGLTTTKFAISRYLQ